MKYPSEPMISTPSYPASLARRAVFANPAIVRRIPFSEMARGAKGVIGDLMAEAETEKG